MDGELKKGTVLASESGYKKGREIKLKDDDLTFIKQSFPKQIKYAVATIAKTDTVKAEANSGSYSVTGVYPEYEEMINETVSVGRFINDNDMKDFAKSIVIGRLVAQDFFPNQIAIGNYLQIGKGVYKIVGIFESPDGGDNAERAIYAPFNTFKLLYATDEVSSIIVTPKDDLDLTAISNLANTIEYNLQKRYHVAPSDFSGISVRNAAEQIEDTNSFFFVLTLIVFVIGGSRLIPFNDGNCVLSLLENINK